MNPWNNYLMPIKTLLQSYRFSLKDVKCIITVDETTLDGYSPVHSFSRRRHSTTISRIMTLGYLMILKTWPISCYQLSPNFNDHGHFDAFLSEPEARKANLEKSPTIVFATSALVLRTWSIPSLSPNFQKRRLKVDNHKIGTQLFHYLIFF